MPGVGTTRSESTLRSRSRHSPTGKSASHDEPLLTRLVKEDQVPWYKKPNLRRLYLVMIPTCLGAEWTSGFDGSMINGLQAVPAWDAYFKHPRSGTLGLISSMYSLGAVAAIPFIPFVTDHFGRRRAILFGSVLVILGALLQASANQLEAFIFARFILGLGAPFTIVAASSLIGELAYPKERPVLGSLFAASFSVGSIAASSVTFLTFSMDSDLAWRLPSLLQIVPSALQIIFMPLLPESPRWLIAQGRREEALSILEEYHGEASTGQYTSLASIRSHRDSEESPEDGDQAAASGRYHVEADEENVDAPCVGLEFVMAEFTEIEETLELELRSSKTSWMAMLDTWGMRRRLLICTFLGISTQWSGNGLVSYFMARVLEQAGVNDNGTKNLINFCSAIWGLVNSMFLAFFMHRFKRRSAFLACTISLLVVMSGWTIAGAEFAWTGDKIWGSIIIILIFAYNPAYNIGYNALIYTYLVEIFPFSSRARGIAIFQWWGRTASFFNALLNPIGIAKAGWKFYISYVIFIAFEVAFVYFIFPETSGRTLEELAFLFEGEHIRKTQEQAVQDELHANYDPNARSLVQLEEEIPVRKRNTITDSVI